MSSHKVPQDVEADDKLIGPFSFRQFVYLIIVAMAGALAWGLAQIFIGLIVIPLPIILLFGALALPLRKDQPMEIYLAALISFYLKPHKRIWDGEGVESLIEILAPKVVEVKRTKDISGSEAEKRLGYLANIVDSGGWAIRGSYGGVGSINSMNNDVYLEAQGVNDVLDTTNNTARDFDQLMAQRTQKLKEEARTKMLEATKSISAPPVQTTQESQAEKIEFNPYPNIDQKVIQPIGNPADVPAGASADNPTPKVEEAGGTSDTPTNTGIIELANSDLSIATISHQADRINKRAEEESGEVVISLR